MKGLLTNPIVALFAGLLGIFSVLFGIESEADAFMGSLVPELIGFCLEGIFFVGIFSWLQERKERERKIELRQSLAGAMGFICQVINSCLPDAEQVKLAADDNWTRQCRKNGPSIKTLYRRLDDADFTVSAEGMQAIQQLLAARTSTLDSLLSVSAQLSHAHLSAFNMILTEFHKISQHKYFDATELKSSFRNLLRLLISFNNETI